MTAFAAGHRPCALCRRADYVRLGEIWRELHPGQVGADAIDLQLHGERVAPETRTQRHHRAPLDDLPDGTFVVRDGEPWLVRGSQLLRWTPAGYAERVARPRRRGRRRDHAALAGGRAARRLGAARAAVPSLDVTSDTFGIGEGSAAGVRRP